MTVKKLKSPVEFYCDWCNRAGRKGYLVYSVDKSEYVEDDILDALCPVCFNHIYGDDSLRPGEAWGKNDGLWHGLTDTKLP